MMWLWYVGPIAVIVVYLLTGLPGRQERRRARELARFRKLMMLNRDTAGEPDARVGDPRIEDRDPGGPLGLREVPSLPADLYRLLPELGGGAPIAHYELIEKLAYVAVMGPNLMNGSEYQAVLAKLDRPSPTFTVRPLPIIEGKRIPNTGIQFRKDSGFMDLFLVEGAEAKRIGRWLTRSLRDALRQFPDTWLHVQGSAMAVAFYGPADADRMIDLVTIADTIFAAHGAEGGPSLFYDSDEDDDEEEDDDDSEHDDDEKATQPDGTTRTAAPPVKAGKGAPAAPATKRAGQPTKGVAGRKS